MSEMCGKPTGQHPFFPHLSGICTLPPGHGGECDNLLHEAGGL